MIHCLEDGGLILETPLGGVGMRIIRDTGEVRGGALRTERLGASGMSCTWGLSDLTARLSVFPYDADLDPEVWVRPVHSWAFLWELEAVEPNPITVLEMSFEDPKVAQEAGSNGGQALIAVGVDDGVWELIIGGPDEEQLAADAAQGLLPGRWKPSLDALAISMDGDRFAELLPAMRGLRWKLPPMHTGERCSLTANVCWALTRSEDHHEDEAPWFAALATTQFLIKARTTYAGQ